MKVHKKQVLNQNFTSLSRICDVNLSVLCTIRFYCIFSCKSECRNADFHRLNGENDDRDSSFWMTQKHCLFLEWTIAPRLHAHQMTFSQCIVMWFIWTKGFSDFDHVLNIQLFYSPFNSSLVFSICDCSTPLSIQPTPGSGSSDSLCRWSWMSRTGCEASFPQLFESGIQFSHPIERWCLSNYPRAFWINKSKELFESARECCQTDINELFPWFSDSAKQEWIGTALGKRILSRVRFFNSFLVMKMIFIHVQELLFNLCVLEIHEIVNLQYWTELSTNWWTFFFEFNRAIIAIALNWKIRFGKFNSLWRIEMKQTNIELRMRRRKRESWIWKKNKKQRILNLEEEQEQETHNIELRIRTRNKESWIETKRQQSLNWEEGVGTEKSIRNSFRKFRMTSKNCKSNCWICQSVSFNSMRLQ
jgi:hypothetical protein